MSDERLNDDDRGMRFSILRTNLLESSDDIDSQ